MNSINNIDINENEKEFFDNLLSFEYYFLKNVVIDFSLDFVDTFKFIDRLISLCQGLESDVKCWLCKKVDDNFYTNIILNAELDILSSFYLLPSLNYNYARNFYENRKGVWYDKSVVFIELNLRNGTRFLRLDDVENNIILPRGIIWYIKNYDINTNTLYLSNNKDE